MQSNYPNEFYDKLREKLYETSKWPSVYLFKFIVDSDPSKIIKIQQNFDNMNAEIKSIVSKNGKYTSVSVQVKMENPEIVISIYKKIGNEIDGVISL
ncbi:MAG: hypothetical protein CMC86_07820 [Flavobacteriaceae bacterium]|nr:hypothetical protein [Flavobacteriaceae bacterium]|tara:strand:+ start:5471 stop:5761 length:291 start_codon:yes stop_codon:yes gene_type:complete